MRNKHKAVKTVVDNVTFHSKAEAKRYGYLRYRLLGKEIESLELQPTYQITINEIDICKVILDFRYYDKLLDAVIIEDVKGQDLPLSILKRKLVEAQHGIKVIVLDENGKIKEKKKKRAKRGFKSLGRR